MSDMLSIGATGVRAYQTALSTVSENIANAGSAGYTRRTTALAEVPGSGSSVAAASNGVMVTGITRAGDDLRNAEVRGAGADLARTDSSATWLDRIEGALTGNKLGDRLTDFFASTSAVAADPSAIAPRATMLEAAASVATAFSGTSDALAGAAADLDASAEAAVSQLNGYASSLAKVNSAIGRTAPGSSGAAAMLDERDRLLESMSALTDVSVSFDAAGRASVRAGGSAGPVLVQGESVGTVTYVRGDAGNVSLAVHRDGDTLAMTPNGGALAGMAESAQRIADARSALDAVAGDFTAGVNAIQANGRDLAGNPGEPMFEAGDSPSQISMTLADPRGIAAASVGGGARDNSNLFALASLRTGGGFEGKVTDMVSANAATLSARRTVGDAQATIHDSAVAARDSASGVNIDEEAVDLMRFQQAYAASSRVIQIARETLQTILDIH